MSTKIARQGVYIREIPKGSGRFYIEVHWQGERSTERCKDITAARKLKGIYKREMREGVFAPEKLPSEVAPVSSMPTFKQYYEETFLKNHVTKLSAGSIRNYKEHFDNRLIPTFGNTAMDKVSAASVDDFVSAMRDEGLSKNTIRLHVASARKMFYTAIKRELIVKNPFASVGESYRDAKGQKTPDFLRFSEVPTFVQAVKKHFPAFYDFFVTAIYAGLREGELKALRYGDLQLGDEDTLQLDPYIRVERSASQAGVIGPTKTRKTRNVPLSGQLLKILRARKKRAFAEWIESGKDESEFSESFIFPNSVGRVMDGSKMKAEVFRPALEKAELRQINFHCLRHTFASILLQRGTPIKHVQTWLGHKSITMTADTYGHLEVGSGREALDLLPDMNAKPEQKTLQLSKGKK